jgi:hypothetical protein
MKQRIGYFLSRDELEGFFDTRVALAPGHAHPSFGSVLDVQGEDAGVGVLYEFQGVPAARGGITDIDAGAEVFRVAHDFFEIGGFRHSVGIG